MHILNIAIIAYFYAIFTNDFFIKVVYNNIIYITERNRRYGKSQNMDRGCDNPNIRNR